MVGSVKTLLKKVLGKSCLRADELETQMSRAEAIINLRPITYDYDDHREPQPLCPVHFLLGRRTFSVLPPEKFPAIVTQA